MAEKIILTISPTGDTKIKVDGGHGKSCSDLTKAIEQALGSTVSDRKLPEYNEVTNARHVEHQH
jgi:hypothetical protein